MYFSLVPDIKYDTKPVNYPFSEADFVTAKNFFRRYTISEDAFGYVKSFEFPLVSLKRTGVTRW